MNSEKKYFLINWNIVLLFFIGANGVVADTNHDNRAIKKTIVEKIRKYPIIIICRCDEGINNPSEFQTISVKAVDHKVVRVVKGAFVGNIYKGVNLYKRGSYIACFIDSNGKIEEHTFDMKAKTIRYFIFDENNQRTVKILLTELGLPEK